LSGSVEDIRHANASLQAQAVDWDLSSTAADGVARRQKTIAKSVTVSGPGTFLGKATRTLTFEPTDLDGWWFSRDDLDDCLPVRVSIRNVWTTGDVISNIVIRSGPPQNYIRMIEHIVALKMGLDVDNLMIRVNSGDPPLFERGSLDLVEALESAGRLEQDRPVRYFTVKEKVTVGHPTGGSYLTFHPAAPGQPKLTVDCAIDFPTAIGKQRIKFPLNYEHFRRGAEARTNSPFSKMLFCRTLGKLFADIRNLGYSDKNILIAGRKSYYNEPKLIHEGKSLEAVWHRAILDLLAAIALLEEGRFVGHIESYRAGHQLDCLAMRLLYKRGFIVPHPA
jgi:UDP-3-O-acyl-N-acetylglucosamine deacetylase